MERKKCYLISPIGESKTEVRTEADAVKWIAKQALENYGFEVIRIDDIAQVTQITNDIIQLIQESELCLIVLTGENPNVLYQAGRRHETGKPFIQLIRKGDIIPFDLSGIRTIQYEDIVSRAGSAETIEEIRKYVEEFEKSGYGSAGTGVSLSSIAASLDRIERKIGQIYLPTSLISTTQGTKNFEDILDPKKAFIKEALSGSIDQAAALLPRIEKISSKKQFAQMAAILAAMGHEPSIEILCKLLDDHWEELNDATDEDIGTIGGVIAALVRFYSTTGRQAEGYPRIQPHIDKALSNPKLSAKNKAYYKNLLQEILYAIGRYEEALCEIEGAIELNPNVPKYYYSQSLIYTKLNQPKRSVNLVDKYMLMEDLDTNCLYHAVEVYTRNGRADDARKALNRLNDLDPLMSLGLDKDVKDSLGLK